MTRKSTNRFDRLPPQRTCLVCRRSMAKQELVRLVCTDDNKVKIDLTSREKGRGAYLCLSPGCNTRALKKGQLERALRVNISEESWRQVLESLSRMGDDD